MISRLVPTIRIVFLALITCTTGNSSCRSCAGAENAPASAKKAEPLDAAISSEQPYECPPAGVTTGQLLENETGHRVILSWNPSVEPSGQPSIVDGYCLYRSTKENEAKTKATCEACERVTERLISSTSCTDNVVQDDATYFYVVIAIRNNRMSPSSNEVPVTIPPKTKPPVASTDPLPPSCHTMSRPH